ncbi:MAG: hypothetical protein UZ07_CHB004001561 [Chlorobi bacterium OLB7]|nr:MAG: hypothetical protein UZ07_CHB004001561 [Chlorobi bacterium OLB7]
MEVAPSVPRATPWAGIGRPFRAGVARGLALIPPKATDLLAIPTNVGTATSSGDHPDEVGVAAGL